MTAAIAFALRYWQLILGGVAVAILSLNLIVARADARYWEKKALACEQRIEIAKHEAAEQAAANEKRLADATADFAAKAAAQQPIILRSRDTVTNYAQTNEGRVPCLASDRVDGVRRDREALFGSANASAPESSPGAVQASPAP